MSLTTVVGFSCVLLLAQKPASGKKLPDKPQPTKAAAQGTCDLDQLLTKRDEEAKAFFGMHKIGLFEKTCKERMGKYVPIEHLLSHGCKGKVAGGEASLAPLTFEEGADPRKLPHYEFAFTSRADELKVSQTPGQAGLAGFLLEGEKVYCNPTGAASPRDKLLGDIEGIFERMFKPKK